MRNIVLFIVVMLGSTVGCVTPSGEWNAQGFEEKTYGWKASYPPGQARLLGPDWQLDNFYADGGNFEAKDGPKYVADLEEDENRDGKIDSSETRKVFIFDLKYVNGTCPAFLVHLRCPNVRSFVLRWSEPGKGAMGPALVVVLDPLVDGFAGVLQSVEPVRVQALVS